MTGNNGRIARCCICGTPIVEGLGDFEMKVYCKKCRRALLVQSVKGLLSVQEIEHW